MNQCLLEVEVLEAPKIRYTQDNQTPIAEMAVRLEGLRPEDPAGELKVVGFGTLARIHPLGASPATPQVAAVAPVATVANKPPAAAAKASPSVQPTSWNTGPLVDLPEDEIPF